MKGNIALRALGAFMLAMVILTMASRAADTLTICRVITEEAQGGALVHKATAQGRVEAAKTEFVWATEGLRVKNVLFQAGDAVRPGDVLAFFEEESVREALNKATIDCKRLEAQNVKSAQTSMERTLLELKRAVEKAEQDVSEAKKTKAKRTANKALARAREDLELAQKECDEKVQKELIELAAIQMELSKKRGEVSALSALLRSGCALRATAGGVVVSVFIKAGEQVGSQAAVCIADTAGGLRLSVKLPREDAKYILAGDEALVTRPGDKDERAARVEGVSPADAEGNQLVTLALAEDDYVIGGDVTVKFSHKTSRYSQCVKSCALRGDSSGDYVLVLRQKRGVLCDTLVAERVNVTVLDNDGQRFAAEGALYGESIIVEADKPLSEGDRVRPTEA